MSGAAWDSSDVLCDGAEGGGSGGGGADPRGKRGGASHRKSYLSHTTPLGELDQAAALAEFEKTEKALAWLEQPGRCTCVLWNSVPGDWRDPHGWVAGAMPIVEGKVVGAIEEYSSGDQ
jgi:hypothetical protein